MPIAVERGGMTISATPNSLLISESAMLCASGSAWGASSLTIGHAPDGIRVAAEHQDVVSLEHVVGGRPTTAGVDADQRRA